MKRKLILSDGTVLIGDAFGGEGEAIGEVIFNTCMTGYQEAISDPTNYGQLITFSYPLIGNYGINRDDFESIQPVIKGVIVKEAAEFPSNWRNNMTIGEFLKLKNIPGIAGIDTRMLTRHIRENGVLKGAICSIAENDEVVLTRLKAVSFPADQVKQVAATKPYPVPGRGKNVVVVDFGLKHGILRELTERGSDVTVVPYNTPAKDILALSPDGVLLSNGPGNPRDVEETTEMIRVIQEKIPLFAIGLGHQLFAITNGCKTTKMAAGHRGSSYPVKDLKTGKIIFTSQNHGYEVEAHSVDHDVLSVTYQSLNGDSIEGLAHQSLPAFSVQFHPEAAPGSEDGKIVFDQFMTMMKEHKGKVEQHG
ncbi:carbamoyl phosphate synthase small subunit [Bacillus sp. FJAT-50079]|uniref:carbamoyl phosphate synthase small subunit n=1 Tax=Bacillus sp. FJAT-50079 TaxID=2833577 RepID=UPI001BC945AC|nr:carbamoyl phosphate synthase small subunit [Bacillus sp. FJAT-50079]MBS4207687.1 carbamoyl phosphate synthase small subunit [Bacillus sp. FJAT-50079]